MLLVSQVSGLVKNFETGFLSDTTIAINIKLYMMLQVIELNMFTPLSDKILTYFKVTAPTRPPPKKSQEQKKPQTVREVSVAQRTTAHVTEGSCKQRDDPRGGDKHVKRRAKY